MHIPFVLTSLALSATLLFSCGVSNSAYQNNYDRAGYSVAFNEDAYLESESSERINDDLDDRPAFFSSDSMSSETNPIQKIAYNASIDLKLKDVSSLPTKLKELAISKKGYLVASSNWQTTIKVPADQLDVTLTEISNYGKVVSKNVSGRDVTMEFVDVNIRLENAEKARQRYLELLAKAENVQAALLVEKELERLNSEIEMHKGHINALKNMTSFAEIRVSYEQKKKLGPLGFVTVGIYKGIKWLFVRG